MKSKNIGIITLPLNENYGGRLQAYALIRILEVLGYSPTLLVKRRIAIKELIKFLFDYCSEYYQFQKNYIPYININYDNLDTECKNHFIDTIIVGSDQVWRSGFMNINDAFCCDIHNKNIKIISYAASFGCEKWQYTNSETEIIKKTIKKFSNVSVREESGVELCRSILGINAVHVLDPTLLPSIDIYRQFIITNKSNYIFSYFLNYNYQNNDIVYKFSQNLNLKIKDIHYINNKILKRIIPHKSISNWLSSIYNSRLVITDSFHGVVFSIIFKKPFYVILNNKGGITRIFSLLSIVNLQNRIINVHDYNLNNLISNWEEIDWNEVHTRLNKERNISLQFIKDSLS